MFSPAEESRPFVKHLSVPQVLPCHMPGEMLPPGEGGSCLLQLQDNLLNAGETLAWAVRVFSSLPPDFRLTNSTLPGAHVPLTLRRTSCFSPFSQLSLRGQYSI